MATDYRTPILDAIAREGFAVLIFNGNEGMTIREIAAAIDANPGTVGNVLRGSSLTYGGEPFERCGRRRACKLWRVRRELLP